MGQRKQDHSDAIRRIKSGETYISIAKDYGVTKQRVHQWWYQSGRDSRDRSKKTKSENKAHVQKILKGICEVPNVTMVARKGHLKLSAFYAEGLRARDIKCYVKKRNTCRNCDKPSVTYGGIRMRRCLEHSREFNTKRCLAYRIRRRNK